MIFYDVLVFKYYFSGNTKSYIDSSTMNLMNYLNKKKKQNKIDIYTLILNKI